MSLASCNRSIRSTGAGASTATRSRWWVISIVSPARTRRIVAVRLSRSSRMPICANIVTTCYHNLPRAWLQRVRKGRAHALTWRSTILDRPVRDGVIGNTRASGARIWGSSPCPGVRLRPVLTGRFASRRGPSGRVFGPSGPNGAPSAGRRSCACRRLGRNGSSVCRRLGAGPRRKASGQDDQAGAAAYHAPGEQAPYLLQGLRGSATPRGWPTGQAALTRYL
jgi:hypothetical protein